MGDVNSLRVAGLRWNKYSGAYRTRLVEGGRELHRFLHQSGVDPCYISKGKSGSVDELLNLFLREMIRKDSAKSFLLAKHAILFVQICRPRLKGKLQASWSSLKAWEEQRPSSFRAPLPLPLLVALICAANRRGMREEKKENSRLWWIFTALVMAGYFGMLRPGELFRLQRKDISMPNSLTLGSNFATVRIQNPKNARQMGKQQFAAVRHPDAVNWLCWCHSQCKAENNSLWPSSPQKFRKMFKEVCEELNILHCKFSPASLRAGGATSKVDSLSYDMAQLRFEGRWSNLRSLEHYIQVARAQQLLVSIPVETSQKIGKFISQHLFLLTLPQFLVSEVNSVYLVPSTVIVSCSLAHVASTCRAWGDRRRAEETIQEDSDRSRNTEGGTLHRHRS